MLSHGFSMAQLGLKGFRRSKLLCVRLFAHQEHLGKALVINAPGFFNLLWRIVQPLIPAATKKRLFVIRSIEVCSYSDKAVFV